MISAPLPALEPRRDYKRGRTTPAFLPSSTPKRDLGATTHPLSPVETTSGVGKHLRFSPRATRNVISAQPPALEPRRDYKQGRTTPAYPPSSNPKRDLGATTHPSASPST